MNGSSFSLKSEIHLFTQENKLFEFQEDAFMWCMIYSYTLYLTTSPMIGPAIRRPPKGDNSIYVAIVHANLPDISLWKYSG